jgi:hypothetical protein
MTSQVETTIKLNLYEEINEIISDKLMADCFVALFVSVLRQWLLSSDHKFFIVNGMLNILETKYSEQQIERIKQALQTIIEKYNVYNDFVG